MNQQAAPLKKKRILVVEDDRALREMLRRTLSIRYTVLEADSGRTGLILAKKGDPDLFLLDVMMPGIDGFDLATQIRKDPKLTKVPLIFLTARDTPADTIKGIQAGARHYIPKPFSIRDVVDKVDRILS